MYDTELNFFSFFCGGSDERRRENEIRHWVCRLRHSAPALREREGGEVREIETENCSEFDLRYFRVLFVVWFVCQLSWNVITPPPIQFIQLVPFFFKVIYIFVCLFNLWNVIILFRYISIGYSIYGQRLFLVLKLG